MATTGSLNVTANPHARLQVGAGLQLQVIRQVRPVTIYRGPTDNLSSISIALEAPTEMTFGETARVGAAITGGGPEKVPFFESLDPDIALVDLFSGLVVPVHWFPDWLGTLAAAISEEKDAIEDIYEPFLMQIGFLERTPRGRVATARAYEYFGVSTPRRDPRLW